MAILTSIYNITLNLYIHLPDVTHIQESSEWVGKKRIYQRIQSRVQLKTCEDAFLIPKAVKVGNRVIESNGKPS